MVALDERQQLLAAVRKGVNGAGMPLDAKRLTEQALKRAAELRQLASQSAREGLQGARLVAVDLAHGNAKRAGERVGAAAARAGSSWAVMWAARLLVCSYFFNSVWDSPWRNGVSASFPYLSVGVLLPCAFCTALGIQTPLFAGGLFAWEVCDSLKLVWTQLAVLIVNGMRPNELVVKRLAMIGSTALVLAHSMREQRVQISSYAGLLLSGNDQPRQPSRAKSLVLLLGRLLIALLLAYVGVTQLERVVARDWILINHLPHSELWQRDGHDNNWLLLEFALAVPFAVGLKTTAVARALAFVLAAEALTCWPFWAEWPTQSYAAHVRLHFATNCGVAGGLLLLASSEFGAGKYTVDTLLQAKKRT